MHERLIKEIKGQIEGLFDEVVDEMDRVMTKQDKVVLSFKTSLKKEDSGKVSVDTKLSIGQDSITNKLDMPVFIDTQQGFKGRTA